MCAELWVVPGREVAPYVLATTHNFDFASSVAVAQALAAFSLTTHQSKQ